jgi:hypothetical protein
MNPPKSPKPPKPARDPVALYKAIQDAAVADDVDEIFSLSDADLDAYITQNGGDPTRIRASGRALADSLLAQRARTAWHDDANAKLSAFRTLAAASRTTERLPRPELLRRLDLARNDPRFATPVGALFRQKTAEASTDDELQALLDQIDLLRKLEEE